MAWWSCATSSIFSLSPRTAASAKAAKTDARRPIRRVRDDQGARTRTRLRSCSSGGAGGGGAGPGEQELATARSARAFDAARAAKDAVNATRGSVRGTVTVGTLTRINVIDLPTLLVDLPCPASRRECASACRQCRINGLLRQLRDGDLDVAFLVFPARPARRDLHARLAAAVPLLLVVPSDHPLAERDSVALAELAGMSFVDSPLGYGPER